MSFFVWLFFSFKGRSTRALYWTGMMPILLLGLAVITARPEAWAIQYVLGLALAWSAVAVTVKRWHDLDKSGWWSLLYLVPVVGSLWIMLECGCLEGSAGRNRYGEEFS